MSVQLTENAANRVKKQIQSRGNGIGLRVGVKKSGCTGYAYVLDYADHIQQSDCIFESFGAKVIVAEENLSMLEGLVIDYKQEGLNAAFSFDNPNVKAQCGCGESFSV